MIIKKEEGKLLVLARFFYKIIPLILIFGMVLFAFHLMKEEQITTKTIDEYVKEEETSKERIPEVENEFLNLGFNDGNLNSIGNETNKTVPRRGGSGGGGGGSSGGGSSGGATSPIQIDLNQTNSTSGEINLTNPANETGQNLTEPLNQTTPDNNSTDNGSEEERGKVRNVRGSLKLKSGNREILESDLFRGRNRFTLDKGTRRIADFDIDFNGDVDLSDMVADVDLNSGKAFMHNPKKILENIELYIPKLAGQDGVLICSNASSFDQIYIGCGNDSEITSEYILEIGDDDLRISEDGNYFIVSGITGTGGNGVNVTAGPPQTAPVDPSGNNSAYSGNVTYLSVSGYSTTQAWQGYFGNVSGTIELADGTGNVLYNWSVAEPEGEVYASTNSTLTWTNLQCFNFTANGTQGGISGETFGGTSLGGLNLTGLEGMFNIDSDDADGVNETFSFSPGGDGHDNFYIANLQFGVGECLSAKTFNNGGVQGSNQFEEVLLWDPSTSSVIFTAILEEGTLNGFNNEDNDFQMLVLEDGHGTNVAATIYYFFAELS